MLGTARHAYDRLIDATGILPGVMIGLIAIGVGVDVLTRNLGLGGIVWMLETVEYGLLVLTLVGAAYVLRSNRHVTVDVVVGLLPAALKRPVAVAANAIATVICLAFVLCGILAVADAYRSDANIYKSFTIKEWIPIALVPPAFLLVTAECVRRLVRSLDRDRGGDGLPRDAGF